VARGTGAGVLVRHRTVAGLADRQDRLGFPFVVAARTHRVANLDNVLGGICMTDQCCTGQQSQHPLADASCLLAHQLLPFGTACTGATTLCPRPSFKRRKANRGRGYRFRACL